MISIVDDSVNEDEGDSAGEFATTVGSDGLAMISYRALANGINELRVAHCSNQQCTASTHTLLDDNGGHWPSIMIGCKYLGLDALRVVLACFFDAVAFGGFGAVCFRRAFGRLTPVSALSLLLPDSSDSELLDSSSRCPSLGSFFPLP